VNAGAAAASASASATASTEAIPVGRAGVYLHPLLAAGEAARITASVLDPPPQVRAACWHAAEGLTTIGRPLYRNRERPAFYAECARATNRLLYNSYQDLYDRIANLFGSRYGLPVAFVDELAIPGFHLMRYARAGLYEGGGWHYDQLAWQVPYFVEHAPEVQGVLNFTLPLAVPSGGTGMDLVDEDTGAEAHVLYQPGFLLFNEQEVLHRIGPSSCLRPGEHRLTLQGHGVLFRGRVLLFW
jgi:hypothetical protein